MAETPRALIKDLFSTGYFFEELKNYTESKEIDLNAFSRDFAVPYLIRKSESYQTSGRANRAKILNLAVKFLHEANEAEVAETIIGLKKITESEVDIHEKVLHGSDQLERAEILSYRYKIEEAQSLGKLLISIIRVFKLAEIATKRDKSEGSCDAVCDAIKGYWQQGVLPSVQSSQSFEAIPTSL
jgi:hypothetical protein